MCDLNEVKGMVVFMENKAQKKVLIAIAILLIVIAVLAYVLSLFSDQEENLPPTTNNRIKITTINLITI